MKNDEKESILNKVTKGTADHGNKEEYQVM